jgi:hypothetical protein
MQKFKGRFVYVWRGADLAGVSPQWHHLAVGDDTEGG